MNGKYPLCVVQYSDDYADLHFKPSQWNGHHSNFHNTLFFGVKLCDLIEANKAIARPNMICMIYLWL